MSPWPRPRAHSPAAPRSSAATASPSPAPTGPTPGVQPGHAHQRARRARRPLRARRRDRRRGRRRRRPQARARLQPDPRVRAWARALDDATPAYDVQQACDTGIQAAILVANKIALGQIDVGDRRRRRHHAATRRWASTTTCAGCCVEVNAAKSTAGSVKLLAHVRARRRSCPTSRATPSRAPGCRWASTPAITAAQWGIAREAQDELARRQPPAPGRGVRPRVLRRPGDAVPRPDARPEPAPGLDAGEAGQAQAGLRRGRGGRDDDGGQLDAADRRRVDGPAGHRRVGRRAQPARARVPDALADLGRATTSTATRGC